MKSPLPRGRLLPLILPFAMLGSAACVGAPALVATPSACASLLPEEWRKPVPSADVDNEGATVADWIKFGDAQTGQLDKANDRTISSIEIIGRCEERDKAAIKPRRFLGIF
jgi:hypothetical protein